jgi:uncharacterized membrane protein HdeD (DUF308 family)
LKEQLIQTLVALAGAFDIVASFQWAVGPILGLIFEIVFAAWFIAVGLKLYTIGRTAPTQAA